VRKGELLLDPGLLRKVVDCNDKKIEAVSYTVTRKNDFVKTSNKYVNAIIEGLRQHGYNEDIIKSVRKIAKGNTLSTMP